MTETNNNSPKISVIVPVYNSEQYLYKCIDSILSQTFTDFELILVNDGSKDGSGDICDEYAEKDNRVRVFHKENGGVSRARNLGLDEAKGEWIAFVDSDDWVGYAYLEDLINDAYNSNAELVIHGTVGEKNFSPSELETINSKTIIKTDNYYELFEEYQITKNSYPVSKLFKRNLILNNSIKFPVDVNLREDIIFVLDYLSKIKTIYHRDIVHYNYIHNETSLSNNIYRFKYKSSSIGLKRMNDILYYQYEIHNADNYPALKYSLLGFLSGAERALMQNNYIRKERVKRYKELNSLLTIKANYQDKSRRLLYTLFFNRLFYTFDFLLLTYYKIRINSHFTKNQKLKF